MGYLIGLMANHPVPLLEILERESSTAMARPSEPPDGCGVGFYQRGEILHKKRPYSPGENLVWRDIVGDVTTDCAVVHLRKATVGDFRTENTHPFRMRQWQFAHSGTIANFQNIRGSLMDELPDFLQRGVRGNTDSECFFYGLLKSLHEDGVLDRMDVPASVIVQAFQRTVSRIDSLVRASGGGFSVLNCILTNGETMAVLRRGSPFLFIERTVTVGAGPGASHHPSAFSMTAPLRYVLVTNQASPGSSGFLDIEENAVFVIDRNLGRHVFPLV